MECQFCGEKKLTELSDKKRKYFQCMVCQGIFTRKEYFLSQEAQKKRYLLHKNSLSEPGYEKFLRAFIEPVLKEKHDFQRILDFGSGPEPALCQLMEKLKKEGVLHSDCVVRGWDPFFAEKSPFFRKGAQLITCLEVAEHFENPVTEFSRIKNALCSAGTAAIGTMLIPESQNFLSWWYKEDPTHVTFYTKKALIAAGAQAGLHFYKSPDSRIFLFQKSK